MIRQEVLDGLRRRARQLEERITLMESQRIVERRDFLDRIARLEQDLNSARKQISNADKRAAQADRDNRERDDQPVWVRPPGTIPYKDDARYRGGFGVPSSDGARVYKISFDTAQGCWVCSCPAGINRGTCKHLTRYGREGRKGKPQPTPQFTAPPPNAQPIAMPAAMRKTVRRFAKEGEV